MRDVMAGEKRIFQLQQNPCIRDQEGLIAFSKGLAREMARYSINVNWVCPGPTETPMLMRLTANHLEAFKRAIPFRRFGQPCEIADAIVFLASDRASYITGQTLSVSGGLTMF